MQFQKNSARSTHNGCCGERRECREREEPPACVNAIAQSSEDVKVICGEQTNCRRRRLSALIFPIEFVASASHAASEPIHVILSVFCFVQVKFAHISI